MRGKARQRDGAEQMENLDTGSRGTAAIGALTAHLLVLRSAACPNPRDRQERQPGSFDEDGLGEGNDLLYEALRCW
ncbi:hypothetical protein RRF57_010885 [Xylaria bambusicola]|uniref:Uncharacterized protein n=1 Tax=Xylaria bambusicola TaxID=326684 RepID=A0AAN7UTD8_9PEZI